MRFVLYNHVGSGNHGCEALVRTVSHMLEEKNVLLLSDSLEEEKKYGITDLITVRSSRSERKQFGTDFIYAYLKLKLQKNYFYLDILPYKTALKELKSEDVLVSIGGDIFCYENYPKYNLLHQYALKKVKHSILVGCSIEPDLLSDPSLLADLKSFELISAREHITYNALKHAGLNKVIYCPDTAFALPMSETVLPENFIPQNTVGINMSPLVLKKSGNSKLIMDSICEVVDEILNDSSASVAFIPHVAWDHNDDRVPLKALYDKFRTSGRVCLVEDQNASKLKWIISQCSYFIGARTHAVIAAYSTGVPALTIGYSVKSLGIARDLFGTEKNFVVPCQKISSSDMIRKNFQWIVMHAGEIKETLKKKTESYQQEIHDMGKLLRTMYADEGDLHEKRGSYGAGKN